MSNSTDNQTNKKKKRLPWCQESPEGFVIVLSLDLFASALRRFSSNNLLPVLTLLIVCKSPNLIRTKAPSSSCRAPLIATLLLPAISSLIDDDDDDDDHILVTHFSSASWPQGESLRVRSIWSQYLVGKLVLSGLLFSAKKPCKRKSNNSSLALLSSLIELISWPALCFLFFCFVVCHLTSIRIQEKGERSLSKTTPSKNMCHLHKREM